MTLAASLGMALPISTPPNAIAYSRGVVNTNEMAKTGAIIGLASGIPIVVGGPLVMRFWGVS